MDILLNLLVVLAMVFTVWWFWLSQPASAVSSGKDVINILVDAGVYTPAKIEIPVGETVRLSFLRKDPSPCAEKVLVPDLDLSLDLVLDTPTELQLRVDKPGNFPFTCQMAMYRGVLVAKA